MLPYIIQNVKALQGGKMDNVRLDPRMTKDVPSAFSRILATQGRMKPSDGDKAEVKDKLELGSQPPTPLLF